ncbi:MAG TPA: SRPBCC domain-containing protein [Rhodocyclaceae bacterium]|nr:SRPBCC domain-containing protein [Rhodocyclaceae bacterium]HNF62454.1 SRPBCC domain-containing protein [Rhodocyclaceae bacterium]
MTAPLTGDSAEFHIERLIDAPREQVWQAHTQAEHLARWWGPKGLGLRVLSLDLRPGGRFHYAMVAPDGSETYGRFVYREILAPARLVWINSFADAAGEAVRHPMAPDWPLHMRVQVDLSEADGRTRLVLRSRTLDASAAECATFEAGFDSMRGGFGGTYDQLDAHLATFNRS